MKDITAKVHATLAKHYPQHVLGWVKRATWRSHPAVPLTKIDMGRRPGGRDPSKVEAIAQAVQDGKPMPPVVLVDTGEPQLQVADGYHRTLGFQKAGKKTIPALIASGVGQHGPWEKRMHAAKLNLTADHVCVIDLAGVCTGPGPCDVTPLGSGDNWLKKVNGLPLYIRAIAHSLRRGGMDESRAISTAIATVKRWAAGGGGVTPETRARAAAAVAEWERKKAQAHSLTAEPTTVVDLAVTVADTNDSPQLTMPAGPHRYRHGWVRIDAATPTAVERATRAVTTDGHALLHGAGMASTAQRVIERVKAAGHSPSVRRVDVAGTPHLHIARQASSDYTATPAATVDLAWNEALHPRGAKGSANGGKFVAKNNASAPPSNMAANIRDFQRRNKLPVTGVIDAATAKAITAAQTAKAGGKKSAARKKASAAAKAAKQQLAQHVATVNAMTPTQRAAARQVAPIPPTGYVWTTPGNTLRRFHG